MEEVLGFVMEYMVEYNLISCWVWDSEEDFIMVDEIVEGKGKFWKLLEEVRIWMYVFVFDNVI